jgi:hypothetical protein
MSPDDEPQDIREEPEAPEPSTAPDVPERPVEQVPGAVRAGATPESARLLPGWNRPDPRRRPRDPAGSFPRFQPDDLLPHTEEPLVIHARPSVALPSMLSTGGTSAAADVSEGPLPEPPQASRFQFVLGAMVAVAVAGLLLLGVALVGDGTTTRTIEITGPPWSAWAPHQGGVDGPTQIAQHVGPEYKGADGRQLVAVTGGPLEVAGLPLTVALRQSAAQGGQIQLFEGKGVLYRLCGLGEKCSIASGKPSTERHLLLRREALELALYSFRYLKDVNQVVVFMPPKKGDDPSQALFFRPSDVARELGRPLTSTLSGRTPSVRSMPRSPNAKLVDTLTYQSLFQFSLTQANQDARAFLVLDNLG